MSSERFGEIRSLLHTNTPSEELWKRLTGLLWGWRNLLPQEVMAEYCNDLLEPWPDHLRVLPKAWLKAALRGEEHPLFLLCRAMFLANRHIDLGKLESLLGNATLERISVLDLSNNDFAKNPSTRTAWTAVLGQSKMLANLRHIGLRESYVLPETLEALASFDLRTLRSLDLTWNYRLDLLPDYLQTPLAPEQLDYLGLHHVVEEPRDYHGGPLSISPKERLTPDQLPKLLTQNRIAHLDLTGCRFHPQVFETPSILSHTRTLSITINEFDPHWIAWLRTNNLGSLETLRIMGMNYAHIGSLLESIHSRVTQDDTNLKRMTLPRAMMHYAIYKTKYEPLLSPHLKLAESQPWSVRDVF